MFCVLFLCAACASKSHEGDGTSGDGTSQPSNSGDNTKASTPSDANKPSDSTPKVTDGTDKGGGGSAAPSKGSDDKGAGSAGMKADPTDIDAGVQAGNLPNTIPSARGKCHCTRKFAGDEACLAPPDPDKGFQTLRRPEQLRRS